MEEGSDVPVRDEAQLLAVRLVGRDETEPPGDGPDLGLQELTQGEEGPPELVLREAEQEIGLVLLEVPGLQEDVPTGPGVLDEAHVVARSDKRAVQGVGLPDEGVELQDAVALHAGDGRPTFEIGPHEGLDDVLPERLLQVQDVVPNPQPGGDPPGVVGVLDRTATARPGRCLGAMIPQLHRDAHDVITHVPKQGGRHGTVDAAAHGDQNSLGHRRFASDLFQR